MRDFPIGETINLATQALGGRYRSLFDRKFRNSCEVDLQKSGIKLHSIAAWLCVLLSLITIIGCELGRAVAEKAPPARTPVVRDVRGLYTWPPTDPNYYHFGERFTVYVEHGFSNQLIIKENGAQLTNTFSNGTRSWYEIVKEEDDPNTLTTRVSVVIHPRTLPSPYLHGTTNTYTLIEQSINPSYKGTSDEISPARDLPVVVVTKPCSITTFSVPSNVTTGQTANVEWLVNDCKEAEIYQNGKVISKETATGYAETLQGSKTVTMQQTADFGIVASNANKQSVQTTAKMLVTAPPPCPSNANGQPQYFTFCASCPSSNFSPYLSERVVLTCTEADAQGQVQSNFSNCTVTKGACPR